jgi:hypothetical protein
MINPVRREQIMENKMITDSKITGIFCVVDDFCKVFEPWLRSKMIEFRDRHRERKSNLSLSEVMTILIVFQSSGYRTLKHFYLHLLSSKSDLFPNLVSYSRFVELQPRAVIALWGFINSSSNKATGISFVDSTKIAVCGHKRISRNKVFKDCAQIKKSAMGWFYGFKLHLIIDECGEILSCTLTTGNTDDRVPVKNLAKNLFGKLFGDKGYISEKLTCELKEMRVELITQLKKNMKQKTHKFIDQILLRKRSIIETVNDQLKNISQIEHTRHRSKSNFLTNVFAGIISYMFQEKKPKINFNRHINTENLLLA